MLTGEWCFHHCLANWINTYALISFSYQDMSPQSDQVPTCKVAALSDETEKLVVKQTIKLKAHGLDSVPYKELEKEAVGHGHCHGHVNQIS